MEYFREVQDEFCNLDNWKKGKFFSYLKKDFKVERFIDFERYNIIQQIKESRIEIFTLLLQIDTKGFETSKVVEIKVDSIASEIDYYKSSISVACSYCNGEIKILQISEFLITSKEIVHVHSIDALKQHHLQMELNDLLSKYKKIR